MGYQLFAWAAPVAHAGVVDHTWVTSYDNVTGQFSNIASVVAAGEDYWFCWGMYRPRAGTPGNPTGGLGTRPADRRLTRCLVEHNADSTTTPGARGTIFRYGIDGVCHQLANQILYATGPAPLTVKRSRGYFASEFVYGTYGLQHAAWRNRVQRCSGGRGRGPGATGGGGMADEFEMRAAALIGRDDPALLARLLQLRTAMQQHIASEFVGTPPDAGILNLRNRAFLSDAARLLGRDRFQRLFDMPYGEPADLVDPEILEAQRAHDGSDDQAPERSSLS